MSDLNNALWVEKFQKIVPLALQDKVNLLVLDECESTMKSVRECFNQGSDNLLHTSKSPDFLWCYALSQTHGVGRQKREWFSPKSEGMYLSVLTYKPIEYNCLNGLSLAIGTSIANVLSNYNLNPALKWPNDVLVNGKKISGILVETFTSKEDPTKCHVIIGVGLNIRQVNFSGIPNATSIYRELGSEIDYEEVCLSIAVQLSSDFAVYRSEGFKSFIEEWRSFSVMIGVVVKDLGSRILGRVVDIDDEGALLLRGEQGTTRIVSYDDRVQYEFNSE